MSVLDLHDQRGKLEARIEELRRTIGVALLDVGKADANVLTELAGLETSLGALAEAETEAARRQRAEAAAAEAARQGGLRASLAAAEERRLQAVGDAEAACRALTVALRNVRDTTREVAQSFISFGGQRPSVVDAAGAVRRISGRISLLLQDGRPTNKLGHIELRPIPMSRASDSWIEAERKLGRAALRPFLKPEEPVE